MIRFSSGSMIVANKRICIIKRILTFDILEVQDVETGVIRQVPRSEIREYTSVSVTKQIILEECITEEQKDIRDKRYEIIEPALSKICSDELIKECCKKAVELGLLKKGSKSTIYDWIKKFRSTGNKNALAPMPSPTGGRGISRLSVEKAKIVDSVIESSFLTPQKKKRTTVYRDLEIAFRNENRNRIKSGLQPLSVPCKKTLFKAIRALDPKLAEEKRFGKKSARERMGIMKGSLTCGNWPWELGQIDHKQLRTVIIDEITGEAIGNPWLTAIIDTNSRVVPGFILSLKKPSSTNIGLCIAMSMIQKKNWLTKWNMIDEDFPVNGRWGTIQADNEIKNEAKGIINGCNKNNICLEFRPLRNPQAGGYIESFFKTLDEELRNLNGFKSKNRRDRENYNAEKTASLTFKQLNMILANFIIKIYSLRIHSGLRDSPINTYKRNLLESGIGIPDLLVGEEIRNLILDFMPYEERTIQEYGVKMFNMHYRSPILEEYIKIGKEVR